MKSIRLKNVSKSYGERKVVDSLSLEINGGEFFTLLGPSGCGKTTLLRIISGLESPDTGHVFLGNKDITDQPAYKRKVSTVFQHKALFPHMTIFENIAYGLRIKGLSKDLIKKKVDQHMDMVNLFGLDDKFPFQLSGGQQQRAALARALVVEPEVVLFDEPMSALDARLKDALLFECVNLQKEINSTFIYITHDQKEALTVADRIGIMSFGGKLEQVGTPKEIYENPVNRFTANFISETNLFAGALRYLENNNFEVDVEGLQPLHVSCDNQESWMVEGKKLFYSVRPESVSLSNAPLKALKNSLKGVVEAVFYVGKYTRYVVKVENEDRVLALIYNHDFSYLDPTESSQKVWSVGDDVFVNFSSKEASLLPE